jgi:hypothetical protein
MNATGFEFNAAPTPAEPQGDGRREAEARVMRAAPEEKKDDKAGEEPPDEPGYGHGV